MLAPDAPKADPLRPYLGPPSPEERAIINRASGRRIRMTGDLATLQERYNEIMRWVNPPWQQQTGRIHPRPELWTAANRGVAPTHADLVLPVIDRWAALEAGILPTFRCIPPIVHPPLPMDDPEAERVEAQHYAISSAKAQDLSTQVETITTDWIRDNNFHRTLLWAVWSANAFGKGILRDGWDLDAKTPTCELMENPAQVAYGWSKRYGNRKLVWAIVLNQIAPSEANRQYGLKMPLDANGALDIELWAGETNLLSGSEFDTRPEQTTQLAKMVWVEESWELVDDGKGGQEVLFALIVAGRVVDGPTRYPWSRLPFHVLEAGHIPGYMHGSSVAERMIPLNAAYDDTLDRQAEVINYEAGPRFKGMGIEGHSEVDMPEPFHLVPLRDGEDIAQIDVRIDFWPAQIHTEELREATHRATGLTPIAWGMSPNAQTSGRAMSAEWSAVELPLAIRLVNLTPEIRDIFRQWWDYAEAYVADLGELVKGYRRFEILWKPLDIRDENEKVQAAISLLQANLLDPESAIEMCGFQNVDEIIAKVRAYLMDPVWNPLRRQQLLLLEQLTIQIEMQKLQLQQQQAAAQQQAAGGAPGGTAPPPSPGAPAPPDAAAAGETAAVQQAQAPGAVATEGQNQPGSSPLPLQTSLMSQSPMSGQGAPGMGTRVMLPLTGPSPTNGQTPR